MSNETKDVYGHCWHGMNVVLTSNPPQHPEICCNCGSRRNRSQKVKYEAGHGRWADPICSYEPHIIYLDDKAKQDCVPT